MSAAFQPTRWTLLQRAAGDDPVARERAWAELYPNYRAPLIAFARMQGFDEGGAEDTVQGFFAKVVRLDWLREADPSQGKLRTFFLSRFKTHLNDLRKHERAAKRGGGEVCLDLDDHANEVAQDAATDAAFDREWAQTLVHRALEVLRVECVGAARERIYQIVAAQMAGKEEETLRSQADALGMAEGALRVALHRMRDRFREILRAEVRETLPPDGDMKAEIRYLIQIL
ncbi:MAG TPA: hypothetical protein DIT64_01220 [Verrucomicrobiales bacterium]|nr:hypothetical protein [Verrucomicrobiales bacterium]